MSPARTWTVILLIWGVLMLAVWMFGRWLDHWHGSRGLRDARRRHPSRARVLGPSGTRLPVCPRCGAAVYDEYVHSHWCQAQHMSPWPQRERYEGTDDWDA